MNDVNDDKSKDIESLKKEIIEEQKFSDIKTEESLSVNYDLIKEQISDSNYFEYVVKSIQKTVKCEDSLIRQILYTCFSSYIRDDPINLAILAPTSEGKTYPVEE